MDTPICDFVKNYIACGADRLHMPGHKGKSVLGMERLDITEVDGADVLYSANGIIKQSEQNASALFGSAKTVYSAEGSSLSIRAMLYLTSLYAAACGVKPVIMAGRNAHKTFVTAAALTDVEIEWLYGESLVCCDILLETLENRLGKIKPVALYITSPDYLGNTADIRKISEICHKRGVLLMVDNAHGAYLKFLPCDRHPLTLGADMCCDSAHKTLPVLTGGGYLHISKSAPKLFSEAVEKAMSLFASTSPSYLILQSLDAANRYLADSYREKLAEFADRAALLKKRLPFTFMGDEPLKLTVNTKKYGYTGYDFAKCLEKQKVVCEFCDPDCVVLMMTPDTDLGTLETALLSIPQKPELIQNIPVTAPLKRAVSPRTALFSNSVTVAVKDAVGKVLAAPTVSCPPAVPIAVCGEVIDENVLKVFEYYGIKTCNVIVK